MLNFTQIQKFINFAIILNWNLIESMKFNSLPVFDCDLFITTNNIWLIIKLKFIRVYFSADVSLSLDVAWFVDDI
jgi:hypothetical protein